MTAISDQPVRVRSHDPGWASRYEVECAALERALGERVPGGIHHIGSTAIVGVDAVPTIDILVGTEDATGARACFAPLAALGYAPERNGDPEMHSFAKVEDGRRVCDVHLAPAAGRRFAEMLTFRELLRADLQLAIGYAGMKRDLAERLGADRERYAAAKAELIRAVLAQL